MDELNLNDAQTIYEGCTMLYKDIPVFVQGVEGEGGGLVIYYRNLLSMEEANCPLVINEWRGPERVGFVNYAGLAHYIQRNPFRRYRGGLCADNITTISVGNLRTGNRKPTISCNEIGKAMVGEYPTLYKAWSYAKEISKEDFEIGYRKSFAFDKQFAIDSARDIYFRTERVGSVPRGYVRVENIVWNEGKEYLLAILIGDENETARLLRRTTY